MWHMAMTIRDVAKQAGVTIGTVSRAFNGYADIRPETRKRILKAADELGYTPNVTARSLSSKRPPNIALIVSGLLEGEPKDNMVYLLLQGIFGYSLANGLEVAVYATDSAKQRSKSYASFCKERNISGAVLCGITTDDAYLSELLQSEIPRVTFDVPLSGSGFGWVSIDNIAAARQMAELLLENGHKDIIVVGGKKNAAVNLERMAGAYEAFSAAGKAFESSNVIYANFSETLAYKRVKKYLEETPREKHCTAFCCFSDIMALGTMKAIKDAGYRIPRDFSVTGFDGLAITEYTSPALTTIVQDMRRIGYEAVKMLHRIMEGGEGGHELVPYELVQRGSVGKPRK